MSVMVVTPSEPRGARRVRHYGVVTVLLSIPDGSNYVQTMLVCLCLNTFANEIQAYYLKRASRSDARTGFCGKSGFVLQPSR